MTKQQLDDIKSRVDAGKPIRRIDAIMMINEITWLKLDYEQLSEICLELANEKKQLIAEIKRLQAESNEGCEYCKHTDIIAGESSIGGEITADLRLDVEDYNSLDVIVYRDGGTLFGFSVDIKYCPMCGRGLNN
ncbi:MAG TPA: hypothetical protein GXX54_09185 [Clostridiales bacterium]|nr:hypothetical protein [Clostridiales bacterium]